MYGKAKLLGVSNVATGIALLPNTINNKVLFVAAGAMLAVGVIIFVLSAVLARKNQVSAQTK